MDLKALGLKIFSAIQKDPFGYQAYEDYYGIMKTLLPMEKGEAVAGLKWLSETISERMGVLVQRDLDLGRKMMGLHRRVLLAAAPWDFDSYLLYVEWNRQPEAMFYRPRRFALKPLVDALMDLVEYDKIDLLTISMPPGTGKSALAIFLLTWLAGKYPDDPVLTGSHNHEFIRGAYDECLRIMNPKGDYLWNDVFPGVKIVGTNAKDCRIDLNKSKRFETLQFTEYEITQVQAVINGYTQAGVEGQVLSIENGIHRHFNYSDMVEYVRAHVIPIAGVMRRKSGTCPCSCRCGDAVDAEDTSSAPDGAPSPGGEGSESGDGG